MVIKSYKKLLINDKKIYLIARKCSKTARNICCSARKLLEIFTVWLGSARLGSAQIFLENELLENAQLEFYFPCSKSPNLHV